MKSLRLYAAPLALAALALLAASPVQAREYTAETPLTLKLTSFAMSTHPVWLGGFEPWAEELKEKSGGRLVLELYNPNTICPDSDVFDCVKNGVLDVSGQIAQRMKGTFPLSNVVDLPFLFPSAEVCAMVFRDLLNESPELQAEYKDVHVLSSWCSAPYQFHSVSKEMQTLDDLKGLKIGTVAASTIPQIQALGATGVVVPTTDCYVSLQRGQIDAFSTPYAFMVSTKIYEATKYSLTINMSANGMPLIINKEVYASMPADLRSILDESVAGYGKARLFARVTGEGAARDMKFMETQGQIIHQLSDADRQRGLELTRPLVEAWVKDCEKRGIKGDVARGLYARALELSDQHARELGL